MCALTFRACKWQRNNLVFSRPLASLKFRQTGNKIKVKISSLRTCLFSQMSRWPKITRLSSHSQMSRCSKIIRLSSHSQMSRCSKIIRSRMPTIYLVRMFTWLILSRPTLKLRKINRIWLTNKVFSPHKKNITGIFQEIDFSGENALIKSSLLLKDTGH